MTNRITIHLHIGASKTGITSIQHMLQIMSAELMQNGYLVFNERFQPYASPHHTCGQDAYINKMHQDTVLGYATFVNKMRKHNIAHGIISAECLMNYSKNMSRYFSEFAGEVDCQIIAYVRNQPEFLLSTWKQVGQIIKTYVNNWLRSNIGKCGNT